LLLAQDIDEATLRSYAAAVVASSEHPVAKTIAASSDSRLSVEDFRSFPGKGAEGKVDGREVKVVSPGSSLHANSRRRAHAGLASACVCS